VDLRAAQPSRAANFAVLIVGAEHSERRNEQRRTEDRFRCFLIPGLAS